MATISKNYVFHAAAIMCLKYTTPMCSFLTLACVHHSPPPAYGITFPGMGKTKIDLQYKLEILTCLKLVLDCRIGLK